MRGSDVWRKIPRILYTIIQYYTIKEHFIKKLDSILIDIPHGVLGASNLAVEKQYLTV